MHAAGCAATGSWLSDAKRGLYAWIKNHFQVSRYLLIYLSALALFLSLWRWRVTHRFSLRAFAIFIALCALSLIYGRLFNKLIPFSFRTKGAFSIQFVCGYLVLNTLLFLLSLFTPFGIATNVFILSGRGLLI